MKRTIKISVIVLVLAVLLAALAVTMAACNKDKGQTVTEDYSAFAGKYYEVRAGKLSADSWFELKADGTWVDDTDESGIFKMNGNEIQMYWLTDEEPAFDGYIADGEMTLHMLGMDVVYRQGTPTQDVGGDVTGDDGPEEPQQPEADEYTITFSVNGGDTSIAPRRYKAGELLADLPIPTREGYNFLRWKDSMGRTYDRTSVMPAGDLYLTAVWEKKVSVYEDNYVMFKPAAQGKKHDNSWYYDYSSYGIDKYIYVELTSNDLGGRQNVGETNNFRLSELEFSVKSGYQWTWYSDDFNTVNGTQRFTLQYGSNIQFVTAQDASGNVQAIYLVDIYVKHDYKVDLYANKYVALSTYNVTRSYRTYWVIEGETVPEDVQKYTQDTHFTPAGFLYYNNVTEKFEDYDLATPVRGDINLFQAYEDVKLTAELDDGTMEGELTIKPYTEFVQLPVPTKEGYDFIGWKMDNGKYFADITGNTTVNYLTQSNFFSTLTAEWRAKKYYEKWDGDEVTFVPTVPYVTYTNATQTSICEVVYVPEGYDCTLPVNTPADAPFDGWLQYQQDGKGMSFNFEQELKVPVALYADSLLMDLNHEVVPLNSDKSFSSKSMEFRAYLPYGGTYTLKAKGTVTFRINAYGSTSAQTYSSTSSSGKSVTLTVSAPQNITFAVTSFSGTFTFGVYGATALSDGNYVTDGAYIAVGEQLVATESDFCRWTADGEKVSDEAEYTLQASDLDKKFKKELHVISDWIEDTPASCIKKAHHHKECENCDYREDEDYGNLLPHELGDWIIDGEYKCEDTVTRHKDCANCDYQQIEENYYVDHVMSDWIEDNPASCTKKAHHHKECANCDHREDEDYGNLLPHELGDWIIDGEYKCEDTVTRHKDCANCDYQQIEENYYVDHVMSEWIEDNPASCTKKAHHHKECENCDHREDEDYGNLLPHELGNWIIDGVYTCGDRVTAYKDCANCEYKIVEENYVVPHNWKDQLTEDKQKECVRCGYKENTYKEIYGKIYFGKYPQTKETDNGITATLAQMSGDNPVEGNAGKWTDYQYYLDGKVDEYMWYIDLEYGGERYRGVYFASYRSAYTDGRMSNVRYQASNYYYVNTLYWFKWEPIEWRILNKTDGVAFLMSNAILDSQQFYHDEVHTRTIDGKTVYPNNYKESEIRAWLNSTFYNCAFDNADQSIIKTTIVYNNALTTADGYNNYTCQDTNDKVFLLSYGEVTNKKYGFNSVSEEYDTARQLMTTGYAQSQGANTVMSSNASYRGNGGWWLRTPSTYDGHSVLAIYSNGSTNSHSYYDVRCIFVGVVPAIKIQL